MDDILQAVGHEFSDIADARQAVLVSVRLLVAVLLGGVLGYERELRGAPAGLRTHMLVALGSALFVLVPEQAGVSPADLTRVLQGVVSGIGFLGAGAILKLDHERNVQGLTTAASIWATAAIGIAAGLGRELTATLATVLALVILTVLRWFEQRRGASEEAALTPPAEARTASPPAAHTGRPPR
ncbi:MgtC/SapB family protein [Ideonella sp. BN130291]|uniref:MgtC/SapB family protein n=1 Tax=Ideonella sp. BN130291 TaxID=3112940 RepID=UPI002E2631C9|nr:MgtC/SapB family protein [Ideonella sp. BN130291]